MTAIDICIIDRDGTERRVRFPIPAGVPLWRALQVLSEKFQDREFVGDDGDY